MSGTFGKKAKITIFGESHGVSIGCVLDGLPPGLELDLEFIKEEMRRRMPGKNKLSTARQEKDEFIIQSGLFEGKTTGTPLCAVIPNSDQHSKDYSILKDVMRPGHADYSGRVHYQGYNDYRGGGHFSGRLTAPLVFAGAVAKLMLKQYGVAVGAHVASVCGVEDKMFNPMGESTDTFNDLRSLEFPVLDEVQGALMQEKILEAKSSLDSVGGTIECMAINLPVGIGQPFFESLESRLSHALFSVPAVKGVEFGLGFAFAEMHGSEANDQMHWEDDKVKCFTNNNGGIVGGITNGMPMMFKVVIKPTPSIARAQKTVNITDKTDTTLEINGRHDPCIVQRAVPVIEAVTAWTIMDMMLAN